MTIRKTIGKSPIKDKPLRHAGQSLEEERRKLIEDDFQSVAMLALFYILMAVIEWVRFVQDSKPQPWLYSAVAVAAVAFAGFRLLRVRRKARLLRTGIEGERAVGQFLERLRADGYQVFHDVIAPTFNIDHVIIGPAGIFSVETKTWSKPDGSDARICFEGDELRKGTQVPDRDPVRQAKAQAGWLRNLLAESTGRNLEVRPVVLFPGWFVEPTPPSLKSIWVLEPKALPAFLHAESRRLDDSDIKLAAFHLSRYIRTEEKDRAA